MRLHFPPPSSLLIVPGLHDSGPDHWQTWLEGLAPHARRVRQSDWETPCLPIWADAVRQALQAVNAPVWIVAHSFGCLASVAAARSLSHKVRGALLVAPANPERFQIPAQELTGALPFPARVIASANDPWMPLETARCWARAWGSDFVDVGRLGHINVDSGHGPWPAVLEHLRELQESGDDGRSSRTTLANGALADGNFCEEHAMRHYSRIAALAFSTAFLSVGVFAQDSRLPVVEVYKNPSCGCCGNWATHLQQAGFTVKTHEVADLSAMRERLRIPAAYASCHSAKVGGYVLEGHVPADDVKRLLREKPQALGLAVPAMPLGAPGMEVSPDQAEAYATLLLKRNAPAQIYVQHPAPATTSAP